MCEKVCPVPNFIKTLSCISLHKTSEFEWMLDDIRIEKNISALICTTESFLSFQLH